jgi:phosphoribosylaminoimidazolecarboxamide formyltransferase/IMP cyclohydrolase
VVTKKQPTAEMEAGLAFAWLASKHVKSNAIVLVQGTSTVGIGTGQPNRVDSVVQAAKRAGDKAQGSMLASDAFFPFADGIEEAAKAGVVAVIQPGGSIRYDTHAPSHTHAHDMQHNTTHAQTHAIVHG